MNQRLIIAIEDLKRLSDERQRDAASVIEAFLAQEEPRAPWSAEQRAEIRAGVAEAERGEFASDEELAALFARFRA
jgi:predicted transcriptional regulator